MDALVENAIWVDVRQEALSVDEAMRFVEHPSAGALVVFTGLVRDHNEGQAVSGLEYEAYVPMAKSEIQKIAASLSEQHRAVRIFAVHRIGRLAIGDLAVVCAVSSAHRQDAFEVCRQLIDRIKESVPVWKRELLTSGAKWIGWSEADGAKEG